MPMEMNPYVYLFIHFISASDSRLIFACLFVMKHSAAENLVDSFGLENMFLIQHS